MCFHQLVRQIHIFVWKATATLEVINVLFYNLNSQILWGMWGSPVSHTRPDHFSVDQ